MPRYSNRVFKKRKCVKKSSDFNEETGSVCDESRQSSASSMKLEKNIDNYNDYFTSDYCEIVNIALLAEALKKSVLCKICKSETVSVKFEHQVQGLASQLSIACEKCHYKVPFLTSKHAVSECNGINVKSYEVNTRFVYGMRSIGKGEASGKMLCSIMNLPPPPKRFQEIQNNLKEATEHVAKLSMAEAAKEASENICSSDIPVAVDGTWQKRGHVSLNGVVTATSVDTGKVVDVDILSRFCLCKNKNSHDRECKANYFGNSGGMEVEGAKNIFARSLVLHGLRYTYFLGDGDSKAFKAVNEMKPYGDTSIIKLECVGHVEKRMGTRLRALKSKTKGCKLSDGKVLGGRGRLTDLHIDRLQFYYGLAIRKNCNNLSAMKKAVWAVFFHKISTDDVPQHGLCPTGEDSWCGYNKTLSSKMAYGEPSPIHSLF